MLCRLLRARTEHSGVVWTSRSVFGCIMIYVTHRTRKLTRKDDKLASHARFITQECCRSAQRPGRRLRALQVVVTLNCTDNLPPSVIYTIIRLGRAGNTAERAGTNVEGDHNRQQRARGAPKRKKQRPREPRQPREQLAAQRWSRQHQQWIIGVAHSHPKGEPVPSSADQRRGAPLQLMLILCAKRQLRAWWLGEDREMRPVPIDVD